MLKETTVSYQWIHEHKNLGTTPIRVEVRHVFEIPESGRLIASNVSPVHSWHRKSVRFADGGKWLAYPSADTPGGLLADGAIALFTLETHSTGETFFFVGTKAGYEEIRYQSTERSIGN